MWVHRSPKSLICPKRGHRENDIDFCFVLDRLVSLDFHNSDMKIILSMVEAGLKDLVLIVCFRKHTVMDFAVPD